MTYADVFAGYEARRDTLRAWAQKHYIEEFGLSGTLLDAGCGNGFWSGLFADAGLTVEGFDVRPDLADDARRKYPSIPFHVADAMELLPFGRYDTVFARTLPQFFGPTLQPMTTLVANLERHVNPGGLLLLSIYTDGSGEDRPMMAGDKTAHMYSTPALMEAAGSREAVCVGNYVQIAVRP